MPKFHCQCGNSINLSRGTTDVEFALLPEKSIEAVGDLLAQGKILIEERYYEMIDSDRKTVYKCSQCQRLHIEQNYGGNIFNTYVLER